MSGAAAGGGAKYREFRLRNAVQPLVHNVIIMNEKAGFSFADMTLPIRLQRRLPDGPLRTLAMDTDEPGGATGASLTSPGTQQPGPGQSGLTQEFEGVTIAPYGGGAQHVLGATKKPFRKKTTVSIQSRDQDSASEMLLQQEEEKPWILEDGDGRTWVGKLEGGVHANYVLFVNQGNEFKVIPVKKWYKFTPKISYTTLTLEEAESKLDLNSKKEVDRWLMRNKRRDEEKSLAASKPSPLTPDKPDDPRPKPKAMLMFGDEERLEEVDFEEVFDDDDESAVLDGDDGPVVSAKDRQAAKFFDSDGEDPYAHHLE